MEIEMNSDVELDFGDVIVIYLSWKYMDMFGIFLGDVWCDLRI